MRFFTGFFKPRLSITGSDFAGLVEAKGKNVQQFRAGDKVMGFIDMGAQSHAEYLTLPETKVTTAPANLAHDEIPACLEGAFYALCAVQGLRPKSGQNALVIGATGAIGSSYVQLLSHYDVRITAVCGGENGDLVRSLGANRIIDYRTEDFTKDNEAYDFVIDAIGKYSFGHCKHLLKEKGVYTSSQPNVFESLTTPLLGGKKVVFAVPKNLMANLAIIKDLVEKRDFKPVIDRKYPLEKIAEAYTYVGSGQKIGNVIIAINA